MDFESGLYGALCALPTLTANQAKVKNRIERGDTNVAVMLEQFACTYQCAHDYKTAYAPPGGPKASPKMDLGTFDWASFLAFIEAILPIILPIILPLL